MNVRRYFLLATLLGFGTSVSAAPQVPSMCLPEETILFSCPLNSKIVSVCATKDLSANSGYVYYRFGSPGKAPELTYPANNKKPTEAFSAYFSAYAKGNSAQLSFSVDDTTYVIYSEHNVYDENGSGVAIERASKRIAHLRCKENIRHNLFLLKSLELPKAEFRTLP